MSGARGTTSIYPPRMKLDTRGLPLGPMPPKPYDFDNWTQFFQDALRYHLAKHPIYPERDLVIHRIETFRQFMSPRVIKHLGALVRYHPRYLNRDGWSQWAQAVQIRLHSRDSTISAAGKATPEDSIQRYKSGYCTMETLWDALDQFVATDVLSSHKQRELFWDALAPDTRLGLVQTCEYFDPAHSVWTDTLSPIDALVVEQELAQIMELRGGAQRQAQRTSHISLTLAWFILSFVAAAVAVRFVTYNRNVGMVYFRHSEWYEIDIGHCGGITLCFLLWVSFAISAYRLFHLWFGE